MDRTKRLLFVLGILAASPNSVSAQPVMEQPADVLWVQIRKQGHRCDQPLNAERDAGRSKPDLAVWVLKCTNATYRIRLVPNMAANVEKLE